MSEKQGILLETGTNEVEIIEFSIGEVYYGINVAKVWEVINAVPATAIPNAHPYTDGIFTLRGRVLPLVNLGRCLGVPGTSDKPKIIVSNFNNFMVGFLVDEISRIHRVSWSRLETPPAISTSEVVNGVIKMDDRVILLLDFEKIFSEITPEINKKFNVSTYATEEIKAKRAEKHLLIAEDSNMLRELLERTLTEAGYKNLMIYPNGQLAWERAKSISCLQEPKKSLQLVITDIEMPQMDGHHFLHLIRETQSLQDLPVIIFSSLINDEMRRKGERIGATAQLTKPEVAQLITVIDDLILL